MYFSRIAVLSVASILVAFSGGGSVGADVLNSDIEEATNLYCQHHAETRKFLDIYEGEFSETGRREIDPFAMNPSILVAPGIVPTACKQAIEYYDKLGAKLGITLRLGSEESTLTQMVEFLGYSGMTANDIELLPPDRLMPASPADFEALVQDVEFPDKVKDLGLAAFQDDNVISVRYFAPKVADYNKKPFTPVRPGWRKLVRLKALKESPAENRGIKAGWVLFNTIRAPEAEKMAFGIDDIFASKGHEGTDVNAEAIQVILERDVQSVDSQSGPSLYFLTYIGKYPRYTDNVRPYGISLYLEAKFDVTDAYAGATKNRYFVPGACAQCHGHEFHGPTIGSIDEVLTGEEASTPSLNYLATDQWYDAREYSEFDNLNGHDVSVLIDAKTGDANYSTVFDRFRRLNSLISDQNCSSKGKNSLQVRSVATWLANHQTSTAHIDRWDRALPALEPSDRVWSKDNANDRALLPMLDRYCARCHITMFFGIYDKQTVLNARSAIGRIKGSFQPGKLYKRMPQGRELAQSTRDDLVAYLTTLQQEAPPDEAAAIGGERCH